MTMNRREFLCLTGSTAATLALSAAPANAQTYPNKSVSIAVPFSAGSMTDILARTIGQKLGAKWRQTVIVENRPGIGGTAGVAKAPPDGYTLMLTSNGHTVIKAVNPSITFDPVADFAAVIKVATTPSIMIVPKNSPAKNLQEFADMARSTPNGVNFASAGRGSATGIAAELLRSTLNTKMTMIAFRGLPEANTAVLRGDAAFAFTFFSVGGDLIQNGDLRALAVSGDARMPLLPNVPTFKEAGFPQFEYDAWFGILVPAGTPRSIIEKVQADVAEALADAELKKKFEPQGIVITSSSQAEFNAQMQEDAKRYGELITANPG
jgi:tripartite-type tricarboxylate transporter receptor subunit TctC